MFKHIYLILISFFFPIMSFAQGQVSRHNRPQNSPNKHTHSTCEVVDLGLPSGTKWATYNIGAKKAEQVGNYYSWGELKPKSVYTRDAYKLNDLDKDITGKSAYDIATATYGKGFSIPTKSDFEELINNCTKTYTEINGVKGTLFVGANGNSIFLPLTGRKFSAVQDDMIGFYWTSTTAKITDEKHAQKRRRDVVLESDSKVNGAFLFSHRDTGTYLYGNDRSQGNCIRPVKKY